MRAFLVQINGQKHCLAGVPGDRIDIAVGLPSGPRGSPYNVHVYGTELETEQVLLWPGATLNVGDEIKINIVEVDEADAPEDVLVRDPNSEDSSDG